MKKSYNSKTIWFAVATFIVGGLEAMQGDTDVAIITMGIGVGNAILRFLTNEPIK